MNERVEPRRGFCWWHLLMIAVLAVAVRVPALDWGISEGDYFEVDEKQHVGIAINLLYRMDPDLVDHALVTHNQWNAKGFGTQVALAGYPLLKAGWIQTTDLYYVGRVLSIVYSILLAWLTYFIALYLFQRRGTALTAGLLTASFDLLTTYGHYALPDAPVIFWSWLAIALVYWSMVQAPGKQLFRGRWSLLVLSLSMAMAMTMKFDIVPFAVFSGCTVWLAWRRRLPAGDVMAQYGMTCVMIAGFVYLTTAVDFDLKDILVAKEQLVAQNKDIIPADKHLQHNLILYPFAVFGGTSVFAFFLSIFGMIHLLSKGRTSSGAGGNLLLLIYLGLSFFIFWMGDCTFVRRALVFLPYTAIMAAYGLAVMIQAASATSWFRRMASMAPVIVIGYTAAFTWVSQAPFRHDNRYAAADYIISEGLVSKSVAYSRYAHVNRLPKGPRLHELRRHLHEEVLVVHEAQYNRYTKSFTTPFKIPGVSAMYRGHQRERQFILALFAGRTNYRLLKEFPVRNPFPERLLFRHLFGTYETFIGDVKVYIKDDPSLPTYRET